MGYQSFKDLRVWREAKDLAINIYKITANGHLSRDYGLKDQMQRAAVSISSNIAEGYERGGNKELLRYLVIARSSASELRSQLEIARGIGFIQEKRFLILDEHCCKIGSMITKLMSARKRSQLSE